MKKAFLFLFLFLFGLILCGCDSVQLPSSGAQLQAWIDAPLNESTLPLAPYEIVAHASDPTEISTLELSIEGEIINTLSNTNPNHLLMTFRQSWTPPSPGDYTIQVRAKNSSGEWSDFARVNVRVEDEVQAPAVDLIPTATPSISLDTCEPSLTASMNTTCRSGPTPYHDPIVYLIEGDQAAIIGRNLNWTWLYILIPESEKICWVSAQTANTECMPEELDYTQSPPYITRITKSSSEFYWGDNPNKTVTLQAQVGGEGDITSVRLIYHVKDKGNWQSITMINMSGEIWEGTLSALEIKGYRDTSSSFLEYYLEATNEFELIAKSGLLSDLKLKKVP